MRSVFLVAVGAACAFLCPSVSAADPHARAVAALALASVPPPSPRLTVPPVTAVAPAPKAKGAACNCPDGDRCLCPVECECEKVYGLLTSFRPAGATGPARYPTVSQGGRWWRWDGWAWQDEGPAEVRAVGTQAPAWDCSSGVCRPVSGGSAPQPAYGGSYGTIGSYSGSGVGAGGSCAGGSCGAPSGGGGGFGRRR